MLISEKVLDRIFVKEILFVAYREAHHTLFM